MGKKIKAVIFDMDGVISDSQPIHAGLEELLLKEHGIEINADDLTRNYAGIPDRDCAKMIFKKYSKEVDLDKFVENKWSRILEFAKGKISAIDGAVDLIEKLKKNNFQLAIASSSIPEFINLVLSELNLKDSFSVLTSGREIKFGKPNPDIFLLTARKLGLSPSECAVIEDAKNGVIAAKKAGMKCVWLTNQDSLEKNEYPADITVKSLKKLQLKDFL
jgi:HAD superfamily hydrolase (TIGR01509 family)